MAEGWRVTTTVAACYVCVCPTRCVCPTLCVCPAPQDIYLPVVCIRASDGAALMAQPATAVTVTMNYCWRDDSDDDDGSDTVSGLGACACKEGLDGGHGRLGRGLHEEAAAF